MFNLPVFPSTFSIFLAEFYSVADIGFRTANDYAKTRNLNLATIGAHAGILTVLRCNFDGMGYFDFDPEGEASVIFEIYGEDAATTVDLCAFSVADPSRFGTADGARAILGESNVTNPATWAFHEAMAVHRTPLKWLQSGCRGVVITDHRGAPVALSKALGPLGAEDMAHARELTAMLCEPLVDPRNILVPRIQQVA